MMSESLAPFVYLFPRPRLAQGHACICRCADIHQLFALFTILLVGRLPWIIASAAVGSNLHMQQYTMAVIISVIAVVGFIFGYIYKDKLMNLFSKADKMNQTHEIIEIRETTKRKEAKTAIKSKATPALVKPRDLAPKKDNDYGRFEADAIHLSPHHWRNHSCKPWKPVA